MKPFITIIISSMAWCCSAAQPGKVHRPVNAIVAKLDSLKNLLSGINYLVQHNPANRILLRNGRAASTNDACGYFCSPLILPVTGLQLQGLRLHKTAVQLNWKTRTETNTSGFVIERSFGIPGGFYRCGWQQSVGNSTTERRYTTLDANDYAGTTYYRLQQQDKDGNTLYSNIVAVRGYTATASILVNPNPGTQATTQVLLQGFNPNEPILLLLTDAGGRTVVKTKLTAIAAQTIVSLSMLPALSSGFYTIVASNASQKVVASCVLVP